jgi:hypothetical protein
MSEELTPEALLAAIERIDPAKHGAAVRECDMQALEQFGQSISEGGENLAALTHEPRSAEADKCRDDAFKAALKAASSPEMVSYFEEVMTQPDNPGDLPLFQVPAGPNKDGGMAR